MKADRKKLQRNDHKIWVPKGTVGDIVVPKQDKTVAGDHVVSEDNAAMVDRCETDYAAEGPKKSENADNQERPVGDHAVSQDNALLP